MPELPEVEHFKDYFMHTSLHKRIDHVVCKNTKLLQGGSVKEINTILKGKEFKSVDRRGKFLIAYLAGSDYKVVFHFGLTGFLHYKKASDKKGEAYAKIIFVFNNGDELQWINKRNFGRVYILIDPMNIKTIKMMGPEALAISDKDFNALLKEKKQSNIKAFLMDQQTIAGIGNDYSNEILFEAGINPKNKISELTMAQKKLLYTRMKEVLKKAITLKIVEREESYPKIWLLGHKRDLICPQDKTHHLKKIKIGGRTAIFCPEHQK